VFLVHLVSGGRRLRRRARCVRVLGAEEGREELLAVFVERLEDRAGRPPEAASKRSAQGRKSAPAGTLFSVATALTSVKKTTSQMMPQKVSSESGRPIISFKSRCIAVKALYLLYSTLKNGSAVLGVARTRIRFSPS
jgi:hypothetical protein